MSSQIQVRRGTEAERLAATAPFANGEPVYCTDSHKLYIGDGVTLGGSLVSGGGGGVGITLDTFANLSVRILAVGEVGFTLDTAQLFIGNGVTVGGVEVKADAYIRNGFSQRFESNVQFATMTQAMDFVLNLAAPIQEMFYWGDIALNNQITDGAAFLTGLANQAFAGGSKQLIHVSNLTYRVFAYPKSKGLLVDVQDPGFSNASIRASYETIPREITANGSVYYVYVSTDQYDSQNGQAVTYINV